MMWLVADVAVKAAMILALAGGVAVVLRRGPAAARHWTWVLAVVGVLLLPVAGLVTPDLEVAVPGWVVGPEPGTSTDARSTEGHTAPLVRVPSRASTRTAGPGPVDGGVAAPRAARVASTSAGESRDPATASPPSTRPTAGSLARPGSTDAGEGAVAGHGVVASGAGPGGGGAAAPWLYLLAGLWGLGLATLLLRLVSGHRALRTVEERATVLSDPGVRALAATLAGELGIRRPVRLLEGSPDAMPMSWGVVRPVILLPAGAEGWSRSRVATVLLHELAHVRRWDCLSQALAEIAVAIHWMNPLAWYAAHRLRVEREHACDDTVLRLGARPTAYATELVRLARDFHPARAGASAGMAMSGPSHLRARVAALLDAGRPRRLGRGGALAGAAVAGVAVMLLASVTPARAGAPTPDPEGATIRSTVRMAAAGVQPGASTSLPGRAAAGFAGGVGPTVLPQETSCGMAQDG